MPRLSLIFAAISAAALAATRPALADPANATVTLGYLRMTGVDSPHTLAAYLTAISRANAEGAVPGLTYALDVTTIDCADDASCESSLLTATGRNLLNGFLAKLPLFTAVLRPCHVVAPQVVDAATSPSLPGGPVPVFDPITIRARDFANEHVVTFNQYVRVEIGRAFTFMQHDAGCAVSGVLYDDFSEMSTHVAYASSLFTAGAMPAPAELNVGRASEQEVRSFVLREDPNRRCFLVLTTNRVFRAVMAALSSDPTFDPRARRMYGVSLMGADRFSVRGSAAPFAYTRFVRWFPTLEGTSVAVSAVAGPYLRAWAEGAREAERALFSDYGLAVPTVESDFVLQGLLVSTFVLESVIAAAGRYPRRVNRSAAAPLARPALLDAVYGSAPTVLGYPFTRPMRECPPEPFERDASCFCNSVATTSYLYEVNASTSDGRSIVVFDNESEGQRDVASISLGAPCGFTVGSWAYPLTGLFVVPRVFTARVGLTAEEVKSVYTITARTFGSLMQSINFAPVKPARPYRYVVVEDVAEGTGLLDPTEASIVHNAASYTPFVILGSMSEHIDKSPILTLFPSLIEVDNAEPALVPHGQWDWHVINLRPVMPDLVHALVSYFAAWAGDAAGVGSAGHSSSHVLAATRDGAMMAHKSFATFGYDVPLSSIVVTDDAGEWSRLVRGWLQDTRSPRPFVLAIAGYNPNGCVTSAYAAAAEAQRGTLALATTESILYNAHQSVPLAPSADSDIVFASFLIEWWTRPTDGVPADVLPYVQNPRYHIAAAAVDFIKRLGDAVQYDYGTTAAEVLYRVQTVSVANIVYGPFSNATCGEEEIRTNAVDRRCQCTKAIRGVFVHSAHSLREGTLSTRTNRHKYTMTTCGVEYRPYVAPKEAAQISSGAIAGIATGCSVAVVALVVAAVLVNCLCFGRNNNTAPKDSTKPFAVVFTDIQSSTALWARAPTAMSDAIEEHHRIMRKVIYRTDGYEVKTVGDSFMVAFKRVSDAVRFALEAQVALNRGEWSSDIDANYIELLAEAGINADDLDATRQPAPAPATATAPTTITIAIPASVPVPPHAPLTAEAGRLSVVAPTVGSSVGGAQSTSAGEAATVGRATTNSSAAYRSGRAVSNPWHGVRVRIGVHYGMGDIRKDPVSLGYDYYGTVVNTAARVEGVGHGGQILVTDDAFTALPEGFAAENKAVVISLGPQPLRGLDAPIKLHQLVPRSLEARRFPPLRLHIEKISEESDGTGDSSTTGTGTGTSESETAAEVVARLCASKQFGAVPSEALLGYYYFVTTLLAPAPEKYRVGVVARLAECWGLEGATKAARTEGTRRRLLIGLLAKATKAFMIGRGQNGANSKSSQGSQASQQRSCDAYASLIASSAGQMQMLRSTQEVGEGLRSITGHGYLAGESSGLFRKILRDTQSNASGGYREIGLSQSVLPLGAGSPGQRIEELFSSSPDQHK